MARVSPFLDLRAAGLGEWCHPSSAAEADGGSQVRLQASIISACLDLANRKWDAETHMEERRIKEQFDAYQKVGILVASLMRAEQQR